MWSRRRFLEAVSTVPVIGNVAALVGTGAVPAEAATVMGGARLFRDGRAAVHQRVGNLRR